MATPSSSTPSAKIRPFKASSDLKVFRFLLGAQLQEPSASSNSAALFSPLGLLGWAVLTQFFVTMIGKGWPSSLRYLVSMGRYPVPAYHDSSLIHHGTEWLTSLPLFIAPPIILLALFEMVHRPRFEDEVQRAIGEEDMRDIEGYYGTAEKTNDSETGRKGAWVLEYDQRIIGLVTLDGRKPGQNLDSVVDLTVDNNDKIDGPESAQSTAADATTGTLLRQRNSKISDAPSLSLTPPTPSLGTPPSTKPIASTPLPKGVLHIRRFATSLSFRPADIEDDLLDFVADYAFESPETTKLVIACRPVPEAAFARRLKKNSYQAVPKGSELEVPIIGKSTHPRPRSGLDKVVATIWPISLEPRTFVLTREAYNKALAARQD
ncbi:BZ3500_MvSof-1268-A1-R1_Chr2-1g04560 [Microbotryum saponariae]|uniref:BZ3500_MvSof-1268-A1-R1_Chr2-1g04560 protein n=1 Tax=Microbotryum saponariae TaxID=289078 RepID=A0A2X0KB91_9BASI|nr:BZ3500_MvSof-1268-A1-R1_Chr2-1g04560 [Microbotryum saponariae]SCZ92023.1 BZ3501_MvSof-1269-A2-R1_Chr2-1g04216 [Microbotryum saponariae]